MPNLCEYPKCKSRANVLAQTKNFATQETRKIQICRKHQPTLYDDCSRERLFVDFKKIEA